MFRFLSSDTVIFTGRHVRSIEDALIKTEEGLVKGAIAYQGKVTGTARIVFDPKRAGWFDKGDILITGMTRPEFLPLMKKAVGFVTDAGGVLSHAAIVARELKTPCVIGTQVATKVFKDGDKVEVDATKGLVRKL